MTSSFARPTRGYGFAEGFLARRRMSIAHHLIRKINRRGCILDIGCGAHPLFLQSIIFSERYGIDASVEDSLSSPYSPEGITLIPHDLTDERPMPFSDDFFDVVTMLAVIEHFEPGKLEKTFREARRILKPDGLFIITTPAPWAAWILSLSARFKLISPVEIAEHKRLYHRKEVARLLSLAGFSPPKIASGPFLAFMNQWIKAIK